MSTEFTREQASALLGMTPEEYHLRYFSDADLWAEVLRRGLVELDGTGYASTTERTPPGDTAGEVLRKAGGA